MQLIMPPTLTTDYNAAISLYYAVGLMYHRATDQRAGNQGSRKSLIESTVQSSPYGLDWYRQSVLPAAIVAAIGQPCALISPGDKGMDG